MRKVSFWDFVLLLIALNFAIALQVSAAPKKTDYVCYMKSRSGRLTNLSHICGLNPKKVSRKVQQDRAYLAEVVALMKRNGGDKLISEAVRNTPSILTDAAQRYCNARKAGASEQQIFEASYQQNAQMVQTSQLQGRGNRSSKEAAISMAAISIASRLGPKIYCPNESTPY